MYVVYLISLASIVAAVEIFFLDAPMVESLLLWLLICKLGLGGVWCFLGHYFKSDEVAGYIGWSAGNPFQKEIAFTNFAMGISGLMCFFLPRWLLAGDHRILLNLPARCLFRSRQGYAGERQQESRQCGTGLFRGYHTSSGSLGLFSSGRVRLMYRFADY